MPLKSEKVITGRSGCWLGVSGEYWWIPASVDIAWLRNFFRASEQSCDRKSGELLMSGKTFLPVKVVEAKTKNLRHKKCSALLTGKILEDKSFELEILFVYDDKSFPPDGARLGSSSDSFWKRDNQFEKKIIDDLCRFGFAKYKHSHSKFTFILSDMEALGIFLDTVIESWRKQGRLFYLSENISTLSNGGNGTTKLSFHCDVVKSNPESYDLKYEIKVHDCSFSWKELLATVKNNRSYISSGNGSIAGISKEMQNLVNRVSDIVHPHKTKKDIISIPRFAAPYWAETARDIPGAVPAEFQEINSHLKNLATEEEAAASLEKQTPDHKLKGELRNYQKQGVAWLRDMGSKGFNTILADEMGLGKTIQTLAMLSLRKNSKPALILCPSSLVENWERESKKFVPSFKTLAIKGAQRSKLWDKADEHNILITSYSLAKRDIEHIQAHDFSYLILDEAQHIKNPSTANAKTCKSIKSEHRLVLTGTPLENSPEDLWSIFDYLHPGLLGSFNAFKSHYSNINDDKSMQGDLAARVLPFVLRRKKKMVCAELPPKQEQTLYCEMDGAQRNLYDQFLTKSREQYKKNSKKDGKRSNFEILSALLRLRQVCCHPELLPETLNDSVNASAKTELLQELVYENIDSGHKLLIFSQFTSLLSILRKWLDDEKIKYEYLDGSTKNRMERVDNFNNSKDIPIFLLSLKAGGTGLNLTSADTVIIYDPWWNPAVEAQATDRTHRIGQTMPVNSIKLVVKNSIEERILELQKRKQDIFNNLVDNPEAAMKKFEMEDLEFLLG